MRSYLLTPVFLTYAALLLIFLHPLLLVTRLTHSRLYYALIVGASRLLLLALHIMGYRLRILGESNIPCQGPFIVIANHQSLYDIPLLQWLFRRFHPKFVAKKELARGIPSISHVLRTGGSALVDRSDRSQALPQIEALGKRILVERSVACIFPEGTRAKDGIMKPFRPSGLQALLKAVPGIPVVPVRIDGTYRIFQYNLFPIPYGGEIVATVLPPLKPDEASNTMDTMNAVHHILSQAQQQDPTESEARSK